MKRYWKEITAALLQAALFYLLPLCAGPADIMGMVVLMLLGTLVIGVLLGVFSGSDLKFAYPPYCALLFIPSIPIYYNFSAMIHVLWYLVLALVGVGVGALARWLICKLVKKCRAGA